MKVAVYWYNLFASLQVRVRHPALLELFAKHADSKGKQAKLKSPNQLQELLDISRSILQVRTSFLDHAMLCWEPFSLGVAQEPAKASQNLA
jgi:hypothetical protein